MFEEICWLISEAYQSSYVFDRQMLSAFDVETHAGKSNSFVSLKSEVLMSWESKVPPPKLTPL